jgi:hypothetical protein
MGVGTGESKRQPVVGVGASLVHVLVYFVLKECVIRVGGRWCPNG